MNLTDLATEPKLIKLTVDKPAIIEKYGEALDFYVYDRQPLDVFAKLGTANSENVMQFTDMLSTMILDEHGNAVMTDGKILPIDVVTEAVTLIGDLLGK
jgi:hypothetical protein